MRPGETTIKYSATQSAPNLATNGTRITADGEKEYLPSGGESGSLEDDRCGEELRSSDQQLRNHSQHVTGLIRLGRKLIKPLIRVPFSTFERFTSKLFAPKTELQYILIDEIILPFLRTGQRHIFTTRSLPTTVPIASPEDAIAYLWNLKNAKTQLVDVEKQVWFLIAILQATVKYHHHRLAPEDLAYMIYIQSIESVHL